MKKNFNELIKSKEENIRMARLGRIKEEFQHLWHSYKIYAFGHDELLPLSKSHIDNWGGFGMTIIESLDTLWILDLMDEFKFAQEKLTDLDFSKLSSNVKRRDISTFEIIIRYVGGLLSAYELSNEKIFLKKCQHLVDLILPAFETPTGIPFPTIDLETWKGKLFPESKLNSLAGAGSNCLEFFKLSELTGNPIYKDKAEKILEFYKSKTAFSDYPGLFPVDVNIFTGVLKGRLTMGAHGDSYYEYILKLALMLGPKKGKKYYEQHVETVNSMVQKLVITANNNTYIAMSEETGHLVYTMEHLGYFL